MQFVKTILIGVLTLALPLSASATNYSCRADGKSDTVIVDGNLSTMLYEFDQKIAELQNNLKSMDQSALAIIGDCRSCRANTDELWAIPKFVYGGASLMIVTGLSFKAWQNARIAKAWTVPDAVANFESESARIAQSQNALWGKRWKNRAVTTGIFAIAATMVYQRWSYETFEEAHSIEILGDKGERVRITEAGKNLVKNTELAPDQLGSKAILTAEEKVLSDYNHDLPAKIKSIHDNLPQIQAGATEWQIAIAKLAPMRRAQSLYEEALKTMIVHRTFGEKVCDGLIEQARRSNSMAPGHQPSVLELGAQMSSAY